MATQIGADDAVFQLVTAKWRRKALRLLAAQNDSTMTREIEQAIDDRLKAHHIPVGDQPSAG